MGYKPELQGSARTPLARYCPLWPIRPHGFKRPHMGSEWTATALAPYDIVRFGRYAFPSPHGFMALCQGLMPGEGGTSLIRCPMTSPLADVR